MTGNIIPLSNAERQQRYLSSPNNRLKKKQRDSNLKLARKAGGMCSNCGLRPSRPRVSTCERCGKAMSASQCQLAQKRRAAGLCSVCGKDIPIPHARHGGSHSACERCVLRQMSRKATGTVKHWEALRAKLIQQDWRCAYSGERLVLGLNASVDHILPIARFPELRGDPQNIEWVTLQINVMKNDRTPDEFRNLMETILSYRFADLSGANVGAVMPCVA